MAAPPSDTESDATPGPSTSSSGRLQVAAALLSEPRFARLVVAFAVGLALLSVRGGLAMDDHVQASMVRRHTRAAWDLFRFHSGLARETLHEIRAGVLPWILAPDVKVSFFRPLVSVGHYVEYRFFAAVPELAHLHSVAWFALLVVSVNRLYRAIEGRRWTSGLATLLYASSSACAVTVAWLAGRNALVSTALGMASLATYHRFRTGAGGRFFVLSLGLFVATLASGETSAGVLAYFVAYALVLDERPAASRLFAVAPHVALGGIWWGGAHAAGYGAAATGLYMDPSVGLRALAAVVPLRVVGMFLDEMGWGHLRVMVLGALPPLPLLMAHLAALLLVLVPAAVLDRRLRFWLLAALLSTLPLGLTFPHPRLLVTAHVGFAAALVRLLGVAFGPLPVRRVFWAFWALAVPVSLGTVVVMATLGFACFPAMAFAGRTIHAQEGAAAESFPARADQDAIVVNAEWFAAMVLQMAREERGLQGPRSTLTLANAPGVEIERIDDRTIVARSPFGLLGPSGLGLRPVPFHPGEKIQSARCVIEVLDAAAGVGPTQARFAFDVPLEDPSLRWATVGPQGYVAFVPPKVGTRASVMGAQTAGFFPAGAIR